MTTHYIFPITITKIEEKSIVGNSYRDENGGWVLTRENLGWFVTFRDENGIETSFFLGNEKPSLLPGPYNLVLRPRD